MTLPKFKELNKINSILLIETEISALQQTLFNLRLKKSTNKEIAFHLISHTKRRIAQLKFKQQFFIKS